MTQRNHHEREFEAFLAGEESELARLYRRLPQSEPDARLDAAVLAMARAAVEPQRMNALRHAKDRHRRPLWLVGLSGAAGVVLAAGLAWQMRGAYIDTLPSSAGSSAPAARADREVIPISAIVPPQEPAIEESAAATPPPPVMTPPPAPAAPPAPIAGAAKPSSPRLAKTAPHKREVDVAVGADKKDQAQRFEAEPPRETAVTAAAQEALSAAAPANTEAGRAESEDSADPAKATAGSGSSDPRAQPFPGSAPPDYNSVERKAAIASGTRRDDYGLDPDAGSTDPLVKQEERTRAARQSGSGPVSKEKARSELGLTRQQAAPATPTAVAPAPTVMQDAAPAAAAAAPEPTAATPATTTAATAPAAADKFAANKASETALQRNARLAPDEWIKQIRELLRAERKADAIENLELLRRLHPDYVLPEDLRTLRP